MKAFTFGSRANIIGYIVCLILDRVHAAPFDSNSSTVTECQQAFEDGPFWITANCIDPVYDTPVFTSDTEETQPVPHRKVSGYFNGTRADFNFYLPPAEVWKGRFFQHVYPLQDSNARPERVAFGVEYGAYTVNVAGVGGYRADAAAAKLSRKVAAEYYRSHCGHIYGYVYGGSGGSFVTAGAVESTSGVWDGGILLIQGIPMSNPNNWPIRAMAGLFLDPQKESIIDAVSPGGSGDPFEALSEDEREVLREVTALGIPLSSWEVFEDVGRNGIGMLNLITIMVASAIKQRDPLYPYDFWTKPGYLGTEESALGDAFRNALVSFNSTIGNVITAEDGTPTSVTLDGVPSNITVLGFDFNVYSDGLVGSITGQLHPDNGTFTVDPTSNATVLAKLQEGTVIQVDNRLFLSGIALYRHQVPPVEDGYYGYDILRDANGQPLYPQRDVLMAPQIARSASGGVSHSGNITTKVMVLQTLLDYEAWPWHADWYKRRVQSSLGDRFEDNYRLYYMEAGLHAIESPQFDPPHSAYAVPAGGLVEQHLLDLSDWVERGVLPPKGTGYTIDELSQVHLATSAEDRGGIQATVALTVDGSNRTEAEVGEAVVFQLQVEVPPGAGDVVSTEWDFDGSGIYTALDFGEIGPVVKLDVSHVYKTPGTYLAGVRISSQRYGIADTPFARVWNLARMRVVVE
ncbi:hypothetical protein B0T11DRAFT_333533 [Plectosphaerella cucumerina]|uniref:PKD domain-containing protein n=1 Tax=Plectosphaerella cucumerina TaxID=40658 RepID=A0A8K0T8H6_9PEZI|nr:hypothetical protein B0T11DRAFT_333533 [Plectosphaerella cucumerina]